MFKVGDEIDGYCPRCKLNMYMIVSATDGREVFTTTCRTCRNTAPYKPEVSLEEIRSKQVKKLKTMVRKRTGHTPDVVQFASRKNADKHDLAMPMRAYREMMGKDPEAARPPTVGPIREEKKPVASDNPARDDVQGRWQRLTANLSARDGRPYNATRTYKIGDVLLHKSHGLGIVEEVIHEGAVMVLFRDCQTVLQMGEAAVHR